MCNYIKDDGEQCGIDTDPFCHLHEDTQQAKEWHDDFSTTVIEGESGASDGSSVQTMDTTCDQCGTALRRRERLTEHPNVDRAVLFEAYVECDCSEHVLGATSVSITEVPDGWSR
jgi:hypothetical protein